MALQIKGVVHELLAPEANEYNGRTWATQTLVVDCGTMDPHLVALEFDPDRDTVTSSARVGEDVVINFYPRSSKIKTGTMAGKYTSKLVIKQISFVNRAAAASPAVAKPSTPPPSAKNEPTPTPVAAAAKAATEDDDDQPF